MINIKDLKIYNGKPKQDVNNEYPVKEGELRSPMLWYVAATRYSGKSYLISQYLKQAQTNRKHKTYNRIYIITPSFKSNEAYFGDYVNEEDVYEPVKGSIEEVLAEVDKERDEFEDYLAQVETYKEFKKSMKDKRDIALVDDDLMMRFDAYGFLDGYIPKWKYDVVEPPKSLMILDDCLNTKVMSQSSGLGRCAVCNRHISELKTPHSGRSACGLAVIILSQSYRISGGMGISRSMRENLSLMSVFLNRQPKIMEVLKEEIGSSVDENKFQAAYDYATSEKYGSLLIDMKPFCECLTFRKGLQKAIIFPDQICSCGKCRNKKSNKKVEPIVEIEKEGLEEIKNNIPNI